MALAALTSVATGTVPGQALLSALIIDCDTSLEAVTLRPLSVDQLRPSSDAGV